METTNRRPLSLKVFSFCFALAIGLAGLAEASFIFNKTSLTIHPVIAPIDTTQPRSAEYKPRVILTKPLQLAAEIRPASSFQTPSTYLNKTLQHNDAYLIALPKLPEPVEEDAPPPRHQIKPSNVFEPVDVLAIDQQGNITQIWPELLIVELKQPIILPQGTHAVLYLAAKRTEQLGITLLDRVEHEFFTPPPTSLQ